MKKKFLLVAFATIAAAIAVVGYYDRSQTDGLTPLQIANIESLSATDPSIFDKTCVEADDFCVPNYMGPIFNAKPGD